MYTRYSFSSWFHSCKFHIIFLAFSWMILFLLGGCLSYFWLDHSSFDFLSFFFNPISAVGAVTCYFLPSLILVSSFKYSLKGLLFFILSIKAFCFGFCLLALLGSFPLSGWLIALLLFFPETIYSIYYLFHSFLILCHIQSVRVYFHIIFFILFIILLWIHGYFLLPFFSTII